MIELVQVTKRYGDLLAVNALDLQVREGEIIGIVGHNGAGKSTTLKMIAGLIAPTSGVVRVLGCDMAKESTTAKRDMGYLPEENPLYENMTAREYPTFSPSCMGYPRRKRVRGLTNYWVR